MATVKRLCVYCGSSGEVAEAYRAAAIRLGGLLGEHKIGLVYGGGRIGLMGLLADAALKAGGEVTGIIPDHLRDREIGHAGLTELRVVDDMHERKRLMAELADAFAILPGGLGTLEEMLEVVTWRQLGLHDKPIFIIDVEGYWTPLLRLFDHVIDEGFAGRDARGLYRVLSRVEDLAAAMREAPQPIKTDTRLL